MANEMRGEVAFDLFAGKAGCEAVPTGLVLRYRTCDRIALKNLYKPDGKQFIVRFDTVKGTVDATDYKQVLMAALQVGDDEAVAACLKHGLKKEDGNTPFHIAPSLWNDLPFLAIEAIPLIQEALCWSWNGMSLASLQREAATVATETVQAADLAASGPFASSNGSSTPPVSLDGSPMTSGD